MTHLLFKLDLSGIGALRVRNVWSRLLLLCLLGPGTGVAQAASQLFTMTNSASGNAVVSFAVDRHGALTPDVIYPTGGVGLGEGLGNSHGVVVSPNRQWLLVVNAGSHSITVFRAGSNGLKRTDLIGSAGLKPVSIAIRKNLVYVLNADSNSLAGFRLNANGRLTLLQGSIRSFGTGQSGAAQISFTPDGRSLIVSEKTANQVLLFGLNAKGLPTTAQPVSYPSPRSTPYGLAFSHRTTLLVVEAVGGAAGASALASYRIGKTGWLVDQRDDLPTYQTAACWVEVTPNSRFAYITNAQGHTVTGVRIKNNGGLTLLDQDGVTAFLGIDSHPTDLAISRHGKWMYVLSRSEAGIYRLDIGADGRLTVKGLTQGVPQSANGLAFR